MASLRWSFAALPEAREAVVLAQTSDEGIPASSSSESGLFEAVLPPAPAPSHYRLRVVDHVPLSERQIRMAFARSSRTSIYIFLLKVPFSKPTKRRVARAQD